MSWLKNLPVSRKFVYAFGIVCSLCILLGAYTFITFRGIATKSEVVSGNHFPSLIQIGDIRNGVNAERREDLELMLCLTPACSADHNAKRQKALAGYQNALKAMEPLLIPDEVPQYQKFVAAIKQYQDSSDKGVGLLNAGNLHEESEAFVRIDSTRHSLTSSFSRRCRRKQFYPRLNAPRCL